MQILRVAAALVAVPGAFAQLNKLAKAAGKVYFGTATDNPELTDTAYVKILDDSTEWGQITPGNAQKWQYIEPSQGTFSYTEAEQITDLAEANGQLLRCHNLVWHQELPSWVSSGSWTAAQLTSVIQVHIANEVGHFKGQCRSWDVVNEGLDDSANYRSDVFYQVLGTSYFAIAFKAAAAADPNAKLYYNDYNIEYAGAKQQATIGIINLLKNAGAKIDGIGLESHFIVGSSPSQSSLASVMQSYISAGVSEVAITELDIRFSSLPASTSGLAQQGSEYAGVVGACLAVSECVGITVWDFTDKYSWIPSTFSGQGAACLYDNNLAKKPAWTSVSSVLAAAATGTPTSSTSTIKTTTTTSSTTTFVTSTTKTTSSTTTGPTGSCSTPAAHWGQCGGIGWTGSTCCATGYTCTELNAYYYQCL